MRELRKEDFKNLAPSIANNAELQSTERLIKVRNPWGERAPQTWNGAFGADWKGWDYHLKVELGVVNKDGVKMYCTRVIYNYFRHS